MTNERLFDQMEAYARELGSEHGANAAAWWTQDSIGGRATRGEKATAERVIQGLEDGDPEIYDSLPHPDLSGQWAGDLTGPQLVDDAIADAGVDSDRHHRLYARLLEFGFSETCDAYESAFREACEAKIVRACKAVLAG